MRLIDAEGLKISIAKKIKVDSYEKDDAINGVLQIIDEQPTVPTFGQWNKLTFRLPTEEEKEYYQEGDYIIVGLPLFDIEVLVTNGRHVWIDFFNFEDSVCLDAVCLDSGAEIENVIAWMPLPKPPKGGAIDD